MCPHTANAAFEEGTQVGTTGLSTCSAMDAAADIEVALKT